MWRRKTPQRALARLGFFVARAALAAKHIQPVICRTYHSTNLILQLFYIFHFVYNAGAYCTGGPPQAASKQKLLMYIFSLSTFSMLLEDSD